MSEPQCVACFWPILESEPRDLVHRTCIVKACANMEKLQDRADQAEATLTELQASDADSERWEALARSRGQQLDDAEATVAALRSELKDTDAVNTRLADLLSRTAVALKGPEPELTRWSWHDLPELATAAIEQRDQLREALKGYKIVPRPWLDKAIGRKGTVTFAEWDAVMERIESALASSAPPQDREEPKG